MKIELGMYGDRAWTLVEDAVKDGYRSFCKAERGFDGGISIDIDGAQVTAEDMTRTIAANIEYSLVTRAGRLEITREDKNAAADFLRGKTGISKRALKRVVGTQLDPVKTELNAAYAEGVKKIEQEIEAEEQCIRADIDTARAAYWDELGWIRRASWFSAEERQKATAKYKKRLEKAVRKCDRLSAGLARAKKRDMKKLHVKLFGR